MNEFKLIELEALAVSQEREASTSAARAMRVAKVSHLIPKPKGIFRERCPKCGRKVDREEFFQSGAGPASGWYIHIFKCSGLTCDYEWAKRF